jgi:hypothetical protein
LGIASLPSCRAPRGLACVFHRIGSPAPERSLKRFKQLTGLGFTAAARLGEGEIQVVKSFDQRVEETLFIPRLKGG